VLRLSTVLLLGVQTDFYVHPIIALSGIEWKDGFNLSDSLSPKHTIYMLRLTHTQSKGQHCVLLTSSSPQHSNCSSVSLSY
jgi:hypothetical protein